MASSRAGLQLARQHPNKSLGLVVISFRLKELEFHKARKEGSSTTVSTTCISMRITLVKNGSESSLMKQFQQFAHFCCPAIPSAQTKPFPKVESEVELIGAQLLCFNSGGQERLQKTWWICGGGL